MDCGCDELQFAVSCYEYLKRNADIVSENGVYIRTEELTVECTIFNRPAGNVYWMRGGFYPFDHNSGGIWEGILPEKSHSVFGLEYDECDCVHATERSNMVRLIRFYKARSKPFKEAFFQVLPQPIAEEISEVFDPGPLTFNEESLPRIVCKDKLLKIRSKKSSMLLEFELGEGQYHQMELSKWYLSENLANYATISEYIENTYKWEDGKHILRENLIKYLFPSFIPDSFDTLKDFAAWIVTQPKVDIKSIEPL